GTDFLAAYKACCARKDNPISAEVDHLGCANHIPEDGNSPPEHCIAGGSDAQLLALSQLAPGHVGVVVRLNAPWDVRKRLVDAGLLPNVRVEVRRGGPGHNEVQLFVQGCEMVMSASEASAVLVRPVPVDGFQD
ncbi:MAG: hypothetical protein CSA75_05360, partial [Sorangium cellulosum]